MNLTRLSFLNEFEQFYLKDFHMLRLFLLRHAKADFPSGVNDFDRPLVQSGRDGACLIANHMLREKYTLDIVLVSAAKRTRETFEILHDALDSPKFEIREQLYNAGFGRLAGTVQDTEATVKSLMIVGHNPAIAELAMTLTDQDKSNPAAMRHLSQGFPPAGLAVFELKIANWADIQMGQGNLRQFITPKVLGGVDDN